MIAQNVKEQPGFRKVVLAEHQEDMYDPLPALVEQGTFERRVVTEWALTPEEIATLQAGGVIRMTQLCFDQQFHPVQMDVKAADERLPLEPVS